MQALRLVDLQKLAVETKERRSEGASAAVD